MKMTKIKIMNITSTRWDDARVWCVEGGEGGVEGRHQWISCQKLEYIERNISPKMYIFSEIRNQWIYCHQWEYFQTNILPSFNILSKIEIFWKMNYKTMVTSPWNQNICCCQKYVGKRFLLLCTFQSDGCAVCWQFEANNDTGWTFFLNN